MKNGILVKFRQEVAVNGYQWIDVTDGDFLFKEANLALFGKDTRKINDRKKEYFPFDDVKALFIILSTIELNPNSILEFADKYGLLTVANENSWENSKPYKGASEKLSRWKDAILDLRFCIDIAHAIKNKKEAKLISLITWKEGIDVISEAENLLIRLINDHLKDNVSISINWHDDKMQLVHVPLNLITLAWLQFANAVSENKKYRQCHECNTWFELAPSISRKDKLYCRDACRKKLYRKKRKKAHTLHDEGMAIPDIAKALDSDVSTIAGWIEKGN